VQGWKGGRALILMPTKLDIPNLSLHQIQLQGNYILVVASEYLGSTLIMFVTVPMPTDTIPNVHRVNAYFQAKIELAILLQSDMHSQEAIKKLEKNISKKQTIFKGFSQPISQRPLGRNSCGRDQQCRPTCIKWKAKLPH
jgi:hypothetical protein